MTRTLLLIFLLVASLAAPAAAAHREASRDARIDAQWARQVGRAINPREAAPRGIFNMFAPRRSQAVAPRAVAPRVLARPRATVRARSAARARSAVRARSVARPRTNVRMARAPAPAPQQRSIDPAFLPAVVDYQTDEAPGTIIVDTSQRYLYLVQEGGKAQRYGVGVGRDGFGWSGSVTVARKAEWPTWTPPAEMRKRQPYLPVSMKGGPNNPLGARALYLHKDGRDTMFRIHGSNEPWTIGQAVSSGCFRMRNEDVTELYSRVAIGTKVGGALACLGAIPTSPDMLFVLSNSA
jgi:lipoprotein-anchoring transpeptidase ErfK/SrfK